MTGRMGVQSCQGCMSRKHSVLRRRAWPAKETPAIYLLLTLVLDPWTSHSWAGIPNCLALAPISQDQGLSMAFTLMLLCPQGPSLPLLQLPLS